MRRIRISTRDAFAWNGSELHIHYVAYAVAGDGHARQETSNLLCRVVSYHQDRHLIQTGLFVVCATGART